MLLGSGGACAELGTGRCRDGLTHLIAQQHNHHIPLGVLMNLSEPGLRERVS